MTETHRHWAEGILPVQDSSRQNSSMEWEEDCKILFPSEDLFATDGSQGRENISFLQGWDLNHASVDCPISMHIGAVLKETQWV